MQQRSTHNWLFNSNYLLLVIFYLRFNCALSRWCRFRLLLQKKKKEEEKWAKERHNSMKIEHCQIIQENYRKIVGNVQLLDRVTWSGRRLTRLPSSSICASSWVSASSSCASSRANWNMTRGRKEMVRESLKKRVLTLQNTQTQVNLYKIIHTCSSRRKMDRSWEVLTT